MFRKTLMKLVKINRKWCYIRENIVCDEQGRENYICHIFYLDTKKEPEFRINQFKNTVEIEDNVFKKSKLEGAILVEFANSLIGGN